MVKMKERILSSFPYLLLALFFIAIFSINSKTHMAEPIFSKDLTELLPVISADKTDEVLDIPKNEDTKPSSEDKTEQNTLIIESNNDEISTEMACFYTKSGEKYHLKEDCRYLKNSTKIIRSTIEFAIELGLEPCSGCRD